jgi:AcrR family transcriptional regulator
MPRKVDHDERRRHVLDIACDVIEREGVEAATVRRVALEAGCSTTIVSHYFANKHQLLQMTYRRASEGAKGRVLSTLERSPGDVEAVLTVLLPLDDHSRRDWHIWFAFWVFAIGDAEFAREHRGYLDDVVAILADTLTQRYGPERFAAFQWEGRRLFALLSGLAQQAIFDRDAVPVEKLKQFVVDESRRLQLAYGNV